MSRLRSDAHLNGTEETVTVQDVLAKQLEPWIKNPPNYYEMRATYTKYGKIRASIRKTQRDIERAEEEVIRDNDVKPRSNDAKILKNNATSALKDTLAELEAELAEIESEVKALEFMKTMFNAANYRTRLQTDLA